MITSLAPAPPRWQGPLTPPQDPQLEEKFEVVQLLFKH